MTERLLDVSTLQLEAPVKPLCGGKRFLDLPARGQQWLTAQSVDDFVPADDPVRAYDAIIDELDVSEFEDAYRGGGAPAYPPRVVIKLLIFAMAIGVRSAREIARRCRTDVRFMWLGHGVAFDHELFSDFRTRHAAQLKRLFKQTVLLGMQAGLITLQQVSVDGSKIAAHAKRKALSAEDIDKLLGWLDEHIDKLLAEAAALDEAEDRDEAAQRAEKLPKELADAQRRRERLLQAKAVLDQRGWDHASETDLDAPVQKTPDGKRPGFNAQIAVDAESGMVVGQELTDAQNDTQQLAPMVEQVLENTGAKPDVVAADAGYQSAESLQALEKNEVNGYVKQSPPGGDGRLGHDEFSYDAERDLYVCPEGHELPFKNTTDLRYKGSRVYRCSRVHCKGCPRRVECVGEKRTYRQLVVVPHGEAVSAMRRKVKTDEGQAALKVRWATAEPTFGVMKSVLGLRQFLVVGKQKAAVELALASLAINVRKLVSWVLSGGSVSQLQLAPATAS